MKTKRLLSVLLVLILAFSFAFAFTSCGDETPEKTECTSHKDANFDKKCDVCGEDYTAPCTDHKDENNDNKCDYCGKDTTPACTEHKDEDKDKKCDACGADFIAECTEHNDTDADSKCDYCGADTTPPCTEHKDANKDKKCDECGADFIAECTEHNDTDEDNKCDYCGASIASSDKAILIKDGIANFQFVVASGSSSDINRAVGTLIGTLEKLGVKAESAFDNNDSEIPCEVLIGTVSSRGEKYRLDPHDYGWKGYAIQLIDGKVLIVGGSEEALIEAITKFEKDILGITKKTKVLTDVEMTVSNDIVKIQDDYSIKEIYLAGTNLRDFVLVADKAKAAEYDAAISAQELFYKKTGIWLDILSPDAECEEKAIVLNLSTPKTCISDKGYVAKFVDGNLVVDCGFENKIGEITLGVIMTEITSSNKPEVTIPATFVYEKIDCKNIYYEDFGALGDGYTNDFFALKDAHDYANQWGNTVHANKNATYYLGKGSGSNTISVQTDTYWHGCKFIFDDSNIAPPESDPVTGKVISGSRGDPEYYVSIFSVNNNYKSVSYTQSNLPITSLYEGATNIGFSLGYRALVVPYNANIKHFIRYGANQNNGSAQHDLMVIDENGNIDPMTPPQWNYDTITSITVYRVDDEPITISGGENGVQAHVDTIFNGAPSFYTYYARNINITRSNVTIQNIRHTITGETPEKGAPYAGFITINNCENVVVSGCEFQRPMSHSTIGNAGTSVSMGSYELTAALSNNILWKDCTQSNFFQPDGSLKSGGMMGTNYCKNLNFDNMYVCSFDAHCGTYNATLKNSTCEHINFIGEGTIKLENMTLQANAGRNGLTLRSDYGSTWQGNLIVDGLNIQYYSGTYLTLINGSWTNHFFGYTTYLPENVYLNNVKTTKIGYNMSGAIREEWVESTNEMPLDFYRGVNKYVSIDIGNPEGTMTGYPTTDQLQCRCETGFNDTDGDGFCDNEKCGFPQDAELTINRNPYVPTKNVYITNSPGLTMVFPNTPQFKYMKVYVDGEEVDWKITGSVTVPTE